MAPSRSSLIDFDERARLHFDAGNYRDALDVCAAGFRLHGRTPELLLRCALAHDALGHFDLAIAACVEARQARPPERLAAIVDAVLTYALESAGSSETALATARAAVAARPVTIDTHCALGDVLAWRGDWAHAWPELECHWLGERSAMARRFGSDEWNGEDLSGKRVVVVHGQGLGDLVQMARYLPRLRERCAQLTLECPPELAPLLRTVPGVDAIAGPGAMTAYDFDAFARALALPRIFGERAESRPVPYLRVPPYYRERWHGRVPRDGRLRAGIVWAGNPFHVHDRMRSIPIDAFAPFAVHADIAWTSLQIGPNAGDAARAPFAIARHDGAIRDLADTAALIAQLDLVIAVDTGVAHLAGALGKPVWLLLAQRPDWRWSRAAETTPWYRSMRLFHANERGWAGTIADVSRNLASLAERVQRISADRVDKNAIVQR